jgi:hypothetical protein
VDLTEKPKEAGAITIKLMRTRWAEHVHRIRYMDDEIFLHNFIRKNLAERDHLGDQEVDREIILK